jgi:hypothetical protein
MMGVKARVFRPTVNISLEDLVPADHFYRHLDRTLGLAFVRDLVRDRYSAFGRPSIDPLVFFKLQLVMFFEGMRSEQNSSAWGRIASASAGSWATISTSLCLTIPA